MIRYKIYFENIKAVDILCEILDDQPFKYLE